MNAPRKLLFVIAAVPAAQLQNTAANAQRIVRQWNLKSAEGDASVTFLQMDTDKWGKWLNSMCGIKAEEDTQVGVANNCEYMLASTPGHRFHIQSPPQYSVFYHVDQLGDMIHLTTISVPGDRRRRDGRTMHRTVRSRSFKANTGAFCLFPAIALYMLRLYLWGERS